MKQQALQGKRFRQILSKFFRRRRRFGVDFIQVALDGLQVGNAIAATQLQNQLQQSTKVPHPGSQAQRELSSLAEAQQLWDDVCSQTDEVHQLVVLQHAVLMYHSPCESRHESHGRDEQAEGGRRKRGTCKRHMRYKPINE
ncbi:hypothetical protein EYF80_024586 [Liparis tanakae]|uniref:Uncharacterized protein n=1 Tax=Liparis tanakae TaxID=230148 RepID=A0A4Z2HH23_9TELE|nr:hypothetical protein EYF80_024586 [Liparis tanakae]